MRRAIRSVGATLALLAVEVGVVTGLIVAGRAAGVDGLSGQPIIRLMESPFTESIPLLVLLAGLVAAGWLTVGTMLYVMASAMHLPRAAAALAHLLLPSLRRWIDRALLGAVATAVLVAAPASALDEPPSGLVGELESAGARVLSAARSDPERAEVATETAVAESAATRRHVVAPGENLWCIAKADLASFDPQRRPAVVEHWRAIIAINRDRIRSGDPDLIYPGEVIELPGGHG